jgi:hypothetical protein
VSENGRAREKSESRVYASSHSSPMKKETAGNSEHQIRVVKDEGKT